MVQVLHLSNGDTLNPKLAAKDSLVTRMLDQQADDDQIIHAVFVAALAREPTDDELAQLRAVVAEYGDDRVTALQDVAWSVLTSTEFTFNH